MRTPSPMSRRPMRRPSGRSRMVRLRPAGWPWDRPLPRSFSRTEDGPDTPLFDPNYPQGTQPGEYRFTPGQTFAFAPDWGDVTPFALKDSLQFNPGPPYAVTSKQSAEHFNDVKRLGGDG